ncbi:MAG: transposase [Methyloceanibacter sp.]
MALKRVAELVHDQGTLLPEQLRSVLQALLEEVRAIDARTVELERTLSQQAGADASVRRAMEVPGIGLLTATAARAQVGRVDTFKSARHFAAWVGLTPKEHSSGVARTIQRNQAARCARKPAATGPRSLTRGIVLSVPVS